MTAEDIERYVIGRILEAEVRREPFWHFVVEGIFPPEVYASLRAQLPADEAYLASTKASSETTGAYDDRTMILMEPEALAKLPDAQHRFWETIRQAVLGEGVRNALIFKFMAPFEQALGQCQDMVIGCRGRLIRDRSRYSLGPHTDIPNKVITALFYLPEDDRHPHWGTSLYRPRVPGFTDSQGRHFRFKDFERLATVPYKPNTFLSFFRDDSSFHGVEPITEEEARRDLLLYFIQIWSANKE